MLESDVIRKPNATYQVHVEDVEYYRHGDRPLLARIYRPVGTGPFPSIVDVHGGAWNIGDRTQNEGLDRTLAESGITVAAIDFRMPPEARYPASLADVNAAIRWFKRHAVEFGSSPEMVGGLGTSSGGHQIMLSAMRPRDPRYAALPLPDAPGVDASIAYVVVCWAILDPLTRYHMAREIGREDLIVRHENYWPTRAAMAEGNCVLALERGESVEKPPVLVIQGTKDANVTPGMIDRFAADYREAGGHVEVGMFPGEEHIFIKNNPNSKASLEAVEMIKRFIHTQAATAARKVKN